MAVVEVRGGWRSMTGVGVWDAPGAEVLGV